MSSPVGSAAAAVRHRGGATGPGYDVVLVGRIFSGESLVLEGSTEACVAFSRQDGLIVFVGALDDLKVRTSKSEFHRADWCRFYQVPGLIAPAFHDAHCHPFGAGNRTRKYDRTHKETDSHLREGAIDLSACVQLSDVISCLQSALGGDQSVVFGEKCDPALFRPIRQRAAEELKAVSDEIPIVITLGTDEVQAVVANRAAMQALQKTCEAWYSRSSDTRIIRARGQPTGYFTGRVWPTRFALLSPASYASQGFRGLMEGLAELPKHGIVACTDAFVFEDRVPCYELAYAQDQRRHLPRTSMALGFKHDWSRARISGTVERAPDARSTWEATDYRYCLREAKIEVDHCHWSREGGETRGEPSWDLTVMDEVVGSMVSADFSIHMHVFGNLAAQRSIQTLLQAEEAAMSRETSTRRGRSSRDQGGARARTSSTRREAGAQRRHKLAHIFDFLDEDRVKLIESPSIFLVYQPYWFQNGNNKETAQQHAELLANGASICYGSDWDITELSPLEGISRVLKIGNAFHPSMPWQQRLLEAFRLYTLQAAKSLWLDHCSGSLEIGKFADICILSRDIFALDEGSFPERYSDPPLPVTVEATFSRGFCIFRNDSASSTDAPPALARITSNAEKVPLEQCVPSTEEEEFLFGSCSCAPEKKPSSNALFCASFQHCQA